MSNTQSEVPKITTSAVLEHDALLSFLLPSGTRNTRAILPPDVLMRDRWPLHLHGALSAVLADEIQYPLDLMRDQGPLHLLDTVGTLLRLPPLGYQIVLTIPDLIY